ncbi:hypothetical protein RRG08_063827 [Elysia crispata]|uniref:Uncharacterized protein n=1 Tax=Elysia crispata TaxID=231223 RepID=A0AAE1B5I7_9GAST|nr:hypothetical protein RRG08_063827 [Elysia crispata]
MHSWGVEHGFSSSIQKYSKTSLDQKSGVSNYVTRGKKSGPPRSVVDKKSGISDYVPRDKKSGASMSHVAKSPELLALSVIISPVFMTLSHVAKNIVFPIMSHVENSPAL